MTFKKQTTEIVQHKNIYWEKTQTNIINTNYSIKLI